MHRPHMWLLFVLAGCGNCLLDTALAFDLFLVLKHPPLYPHQPARALRRKNRQHCQCRGHCEDCDEIYLH